SPSHSAAALHVPPPPGRPSLLGQASANCFQMHSASELQSSGEERAQERKTGAFVWQLVLQVLSYWTPHWMSLMQVSSHTCLSVFIAAIARSAVPKGFPPPPLVPPPQPATTSAHI